MKDKEINEKDKLIETEGRKIIVKSVLYKSYYNSPIGKIILHSDGTYLTRLDFDNSKYIDKINKIVATIDDSLEIFIKTKTWLDRYFNAENPNVCEIPIKLEGTEFSQKVWKELKEIPYGKTITYGEIAKATKGMCTQAVGHAIGLNPISIIVPCHRVVGANGSLTGYAGGIDKKLKLLKIENVDTTNFYIPTKGSAL